MRTETPEFDFFEIEKQSSKKPDAEKPPKFQRAAQGIQRTVSRINPLMLKNVIATTRSFTGKSLENTPFSGEMVRPSSENHLPGIAPLTIFYDGRVYVFAVLPDKAEKIMKLAESGNYSFIESASQLNESTPPSPSFQCHGSKELRLGSLHEDLPLARKKSLQRFLEKRKERLTSMDPYAIMSENGGKNTMELSKA